MRSPRSAKEVGSDFPYKCSTMSYLEVLKDGTANNFSHKNQCDRANVQEAYDRAIKGESVIYVAWPGNWATDMFVIDDLSAFAKAFLLSTGEAEHLHSFTWCVSKDDRNELQTVHIEVIFTCGCVLTDSDSRSFAEFAHKHLGWDVRVTRNFGRRYGVHEKQENYYVHDVYVSRYSLKNKSSGSFNIK